jgi:NADPH:quinone reductase-like Zn-dependent oxidoreductase
MRSRCLRDKAAWLAGLVTRGHKWSPVLEPPSLLDVELSVPAPGANDLRVRVEAVSVNPVDVKVRAPKSKSETLPRVLGWDAAGVVDAVGDAVTTFRPGDRVYQAGDIARSGSNAEVHLGLSAFLTNARRATSSAWPLPSHGTPD